MRIYERDFSTQDAINIAMKIFEKEKLKFKMYQFGNDIKTTSIVLNKLDAKNEHHQGNGKGIQQQSIASAMFESLEHFYSCPITNKRKTFKSKISDVYNKDKSNTEYPISNLYKMNPDFEMDCESYTLLGSRHTRIPYPAFLSHPHYFEEKTNNIKYKLFATNGGTATGVSFEEAILHGVNELIERDAISLHLINSFLSKNSNLKLINITTIPSYLKEILEVCKINMCDIKIFDITSDLNIPTYLVVAKMEGKTLPIVGSGSSLFTEYALERALLEALQSLHLHTKDLEHEDIENIQRISKYKPLINSLLLAYDQSKFSYIDFLQSPENHLKLNVKEQLQIIQQRLKTHDFNVYFNILEQSNNFYCVKTLIPGFEKFHLVRGGLSIPPSSRGLKYLNWLEGEAYKEL